MFTVTSRRKYPILVTLGYKVMLFNPKGTLIRVSAFSPFPQKPEHLFIQY